MRGAVQESLRWLPILLSVTGIHAQTCLVLSRPIPGSNGTATFSLSLQSGPGTRPATLQWAFQYSSSTISSLTVDDGPALASIGKTTFCAGDSDSFNCVAVGLNTNSMRDGIIAKVRASLAPGADSANLVIKSSLAASREGYFVSVVPISAVDTNATCRPPLHRGGAVGK